MSCLVAILLLLLLLLLLLECVAYLVFAVP